MRLLKKLSTALIAFAIVLIIPISTFALDDNCISLRSFFDDCDNTIVFDGTDGINGSANYIIDKNDGCLYFSAKFFDDYMTDDKIYFRFFVKNSATAFSFDVYEADNTNNDNVEIISDISNKTKDNSCKAIIGIQISDKASRKLNNNISCSYYCGSNRSAVMFENISINMEKETTAKKTTAKNSSTEKTTKKHTDKKTTEKKSKTTEKASENKTTKFTTYKPMTSQKERSSTTKYSPSKSVEVTTSNNTQQSDEEYWSEVLSSNNAKSSNVKVNDSSESEMTDLSEFLIIAGAVVILSGLVVFVYGLLYKKKSDRKKNDQDE